MVGGHIDANTLKLKPISEKPVKGGYVQLGIAPYGGPVIGTWWDRDLGVAGKVLVKDSDGRVVPKLVNLGWPSKFSCWVVMLKGVHCSMLIESSCSNSLTRASSLRNSRRASWEHRNRDGTDNWP
jgi:hypothetical protein